MLIKESLYTKSETELILKQADMFTESLVTKDGSDSYVKHSKRKSQESIIDSNKVSNIILPKLKPFGVNSLPSIVKIIKYEEGSFFEKHSDRTHNHLTHRIKTLIIQLSEDYEGADLIVQNKVCSKKLGTLILFDALTKHEVTKLLNGKRYSLICWLEKDNLDSNQSLL